MIPTYRRVDDGAIMLWYEVYSTAALNTLEAPVTAIHGPWLWWEE